MNVTLCFAVRSLRRTMKDFGYSEGRIQAVLEYYLLSPHEYAQRQALRLQVGNWIVYELNRKVREKVEA